MAGNEQIPTAVTRLLSARYPTLEVDPSWLSNCVDRIRKRDAALRTGSPDQLAKAVRQELLDTDLAHVVPPSYSRINAQRLGSFADKVGDAGRGTILVQIESMMDIGYSASSQLEIAGARREARRANVDPNDVPADTKVVDAAEADHMTDFQAQEDDKIQASTVFPRRMLKLELSDGSKGANVFAIELQRISGLDMNTTSIGSKLLLKGALIKDGYLLLTPQTVVVEGGRVREKDEIAEDKLIDYWRLQLGKPAQSDSSANGTQLPAVCRTDVAASAAIERGFSPDDDESELLAALDGGEVRMAPVNSSRRVSAFATTGTRNISTNTNDPGRAAAQPPAPTRPRAMLVVPESFTQASTDKSRSQNTAPKTSATQDDPISLIDSDDEDALFASVPDAVLGGGKDMADQSEKLGRRRERSMQEQPASTRSYANSREEPIVIESSPEP